MLSQDAFLPQNLSMLLLVSLLGLAAIAALLRSFSRIRCQVRRRRRCEQELSL